MYSYVFIALLLVLMWALLIRPQQRRRREQAQMLSELAVGDDVITMGGIYGRVRGLADDHVTLEIAPQTQVRVAKSAVAARLEPQPAETAANPR